MSKTDIDWYRLPEPQADGYDSDVTLSCAAEMGYIPPADVEEPRFLDDTISLRGDQDLLFPDDCVHADHTHLNVELAASLLRLWPEVHGQCKRLLDRVTLFQQTDIHDDFVVGSICGPGTTGFGSIGVTVNHHVGFAEGVVHELAHHKLRALGVDFESATRLIRNEPTSLHPSPIRYDSLRPMVAVLHAQYSYTYILQLDLKILEARLDEERDRCIVEHSIAIIAPKIEFGHAVLRQHASTDEAGTRFLAGLSSWTDRILSGCERWLDTYDVKRQPFTHPIAG